MIDPEAQLRRLAESRAESVEPFSPAELDRPVAEVIELPPRRWPTAVAAVLLAIVAVGAGVFAAFGGPDRDGSGELADLASIGEDDSGTATDDTSSSATTTTIRTGVSIPDVVGDDVDVASETLRDAGINIELGAFFVTGDDARLGSVVEVIPGGQFVEVVVARLAPSLMSTDPCQRPPHLLGNFDDDLLVDRVYPRFVEGRITEIEICTGTGARSTLGGLDLHRLEFAGDLDADGLDELVASADAGDAGSRVLSLVDGEIVERSVSDFGVVIESVEPDVPCAVREMDVAMVGDVDGDGDDDVVAPRDGIVCFGSGPVVSLGDLAVGAGTWFLDDIDDDGTLELFVGQTSADELWVRPYSIATDGVITPAADADCCVQTVPAAATAPDHPAAADTDDVDAENADDDTATEADLSSDTARWFSCVAEGHGHPAELISGRFWIDVDAGTVEWTIDVGSEASPDIHTMTFADPLATDAWIPGNGCRNNVGVWALPVSIDFRDDETAEADTIAAFNASIATDDPGRRLVRLREALGIANDLRDAAGPYTEDLAEGYFELGGLLDDSVAAARWNFEFSDDGSALIAVTRTWACQPGRGHEEFSTELCT